MRVTLLPSHTAARGSGVGGGRGVGGEQARGARARQTFLTLGQWVTVPRLRRLGRVAGPSRDLTAAVAAVGSR